MHKPPLLIKPSQLMCLLVALLLAGTGCEPRSSTFQERAEDAADFVQEHSEGFETVKTRTQKFHTCPGDADGQLCGALKALGADAAYRCPDLPAEIAYACTTALPDSVVAIRVVGRDSLTQYFIYRGKKPPASSGFRFAALPRNWHYLESPVD